MTKKLMFGTVVLVLTAGLLLLIGPGAVAEGTGAKAANASDGVGKTTATVEGVGTIKMAHDLAAWGRANGNPAALAVAAKVLRSVPTQPMKGKAAKKETEGPDLPAKGKEGKETTPESLQAEAKEMCEKNEANLSAVQAIAKMPPAKVRGAKGGPIRHKDVVKARSTDIYKITFRGGELAEVGVAGDGKTDLDLYVYDENKNLIASDTDKTARCYVRWTPKWTGLFYVTIKNTGQVPSQYVLLTN